MNSTHKKAFNGWYEQNIEFRDDPDLTFPDVARDAWDACAEFMAKNIKPIIRKMSARELVGYCETYHNGNYEEMKACIIAEEIKEEYKT